LALGTGWIGVGPVRPCRGIRGTNRQTNKCGCAPCSCKGARTKWKLLIPSSTCHDNIPLHRMRTTLPVVWFGWKLTQLAERANRLAVYESYGAGEATTNSTSPLNGSTPFKSTMGARHGQRCAVGDGNSQSVRCSREHRPQVELEDETQMMASRSTMSYSTTGPRVPARQPPTCVRPPAERRGSGEHELCRFSPGNVRRPPLACSSN